MSVWLYGVITFAAAWGWVSTWALVSRPPRPAWREDLDVLCSVERWLPVSFLALCSTVLAVGGWLDLLTGGVLAGITVGAQAATGPAQRRRQRRLTADAP